MRRRKLTQLHLDHYPRSTPEQKEQMQESVFTYYYDRNDMDIEAAIEEIEFDMHVLEKQEQFERCQLLKDVLDRFE